MSSARGPSLPPPPTVTTVTTVNEQPSQPSDPSKGVREQREPREDDDLVERARTGDRAAFQQLFQKYHRRAYAVALGVLKRPDDAMDVVQDAFIKVHKNIGSFQGASSFYTWLYRIVMNLAIDHIRRTRKVVEWGDDVSVHDAAGDGALVPKLEDAHPGRTVERRELSEKIRQALDALPEYHRAVILLREVEGMSYEEMAEVLHVPKGTIMSRLFHARRKMQELLQTYLEGDLQIAD
jgi:RNA polymerase sigma-70 factor (ECF subfamily)